MKTIEELKARFASIQDLPVSEEMLGAYIEGNLDLIHSQCVERLMQQDDDFASFVDECKTDILNDQSNNWDKPINFMGMEDVSLPELPIDAMDQYGNGETSVFLDPFNLFEGEVCAIPSYDFIDNNEIFSDDFDRFYIDDNSLDIETPLEGDVSDDLDL